VLFSEDFSCDNILYIGDSPKEFLKIIEKFNGRLQRIGQSYADLVCEDKEPGSSDRWLQHHIQYHFEGGIAVFKFRNGEWLPAIIREECRKACRSLAFEQIYFPS
jgi:hypothetical protein